MFGISKSFMESSLSMKYLDDIQKWLFLNTGAYKEGFWGAIQSAYSFIQVIGFALIATFFLKALLTESAKENLTIETLGKMMIGLVLALAVITHIPEITNAFLKISENAAGAILSDETLTRDGESAITTAVEAWKKETPNPIAFFQALLFYVLHQICIIAFDFAIISRALDIGWRVAVAPISCADMFEGANSPGVKHLKSIFGSALVALIMAIIAKAGALLVGGFLQDTTNGSFWMAVACQAAIAGAAIGANQKAKEIL